MNSMSLLRNSVIVGGATFLVGSAFMEIGKADSKSDIGKWPYIATFLSGALGFYLLKQQFVPVPKALELDAENFSKDFTFNIDIDEAIIENRDELKDRGYSDEDIEDLEEEIIDNINEDDILDQIKSDDLDSIMGGTMDFDDEVYLKRRDGMVEDVEASIDYEVDAGGWNAESLSSLQSFAAEVFMADRKIRRRTRWTWTRGPEKGFEDKDKVPYAQIYAQTVRQGRGYYGNIVPEYKIEDSYHISDLPEGYHLHLLKPTLRKSNWVAVAKSPNDKEWKDYTSSAKAGLTKKLLDWYNKDIATPEVKPLSPIDKLKIKRGIKSGKVGIDRVFIPEVMDKKGNILTQEEVQFYASGGPDALTPFHFASYFPNESSLSNMKIYGNYNTLIKYEVLSFAQGLAFMGDKVTTLRSVNRFNKNREQWVKSYPAWFQNSVKNKISYLSMSISQIEANNANFTINGTTIVKFINGKKKYSWSEVTPRETITVYGEELPQFQVLMPNGNLETPRPSSQRKIYENAMNQNDEGTWDVNEFELMLALVDKYKFENSIAVINEKMTLSQTPNIWRANNQTKNLISSLELMCRRFKKN